MFGNTNLGRFFGESPRDRELRDTREAWNETERLWKGSPLGTSSLNQLAFTIMRDAMRKAPRVPAIPVLIALHQATEEILRWEDIIALEAEWPLIESDMEVALGIRQMLVRRKRWSTDFERMWGAVQRQLVDGYLWLFENLPETCFGKWEHADAAFEVQLIELLDDPAAVIGKFLLVPYDDDTLRYDLLLKLRRGLERNLLVASGFSPTENAVQVQERLLWPDKQRRKSPRELGEMYLTGTPFAAFTELQVPFHVPLEARFEHAHIVGGTGHGKTQLLQRMIHTDLVAAQTERRSVVVIDSQGDLINKLVRLDIFSPDHPNSLADRLVLIDPADVEFPASLNLFDAKLDRLKDYRLVDRERVLNGVVELYEGFFGGLLGAELTQKQGVIFRYLARLMLTIPGATIHTLMQLMEDGRKFKPQMDKLDGSARYFFETEFFHPSFAATKKQILRRLWGVLSTPAFERMFAQPSNKLDLFAAMNEGKIILVSTAKDLLKQDGSALFGRFFIGMLAQAALERSTLAPEERTPTFVYVDEAQEYFDDNVEAILTQARKYALAIHCAHQSLDQLSPRLRSAFHSNTSLKCAGGVSAKDARALADELHSTPEFIESMRRRKDRSEFAVWLKHQTPHAIRLSVPLGFLERQPTLDDDAYEALLTRNREQYCGTLADMVSFASTPTFVEPIVVDEPPVRPAAEPVEAIEPRERREPAQRPSLERELGKGGRQHRYLQSLVKELGEAQGFRSTIEAPLRGGVGQVDVLLERDSTTAAFEISVSTPLEHERGNLRKCLSAGYTCVAVVLSKSKATQGRYRASLAEGLTDAERAPVSFLTPEEVPDFIVSLLPPPPPEEQIVKGYRVKVSRTTVSPEEARTRRDTLARMMAASMNRQK